MLGISLLVETLGASGEDIQDMMRDLDLAAFALCGITTGSKMFSKSVELNYLTQVRDLGAHWYIPAIGQPLG